MKRFKRGGLQHIMSACAQWSVTRTFTRRSLHGCLHLALAVKELMLYTTIIFAL